MKFLPLITFLTLFVAAAVAFEPLRQVMITYPMDTSSTFLDGARARIEAAGGEILHQFELIKGFVVKASVRALTEFEESAAFPGPRATIEDDQQIYELGGEKTRRRPR